MKILLKRAYEKVAAEDGFGVLVDRLWPRGKKKVDLRLWPHGQRTSHPAQNCGNGLVTTRRGGSNSASVMRLS